MDAVNYLKTKTRICKRYQCDKCPFEDNCDTIEESHPEKAVEIVEKWLKDNPPETILSKFLKNYPEAKSWLNSAGIPSFCCCYLGFLSCCDNKIGCEECWNRPIE